MWFFLVAAVVVAFVAILAAFWYRELYLDKVAQVSWLRHTLNTERRGWDAERHKLQTRLDNAEQRYRMEHNLNRAMNAAGSEEA
jgi:hypothetical protein